MLTTLKVGVLLAEAADHLHFAEDGSPIDLIDCDKEPCDVIHEYIYLEEEIDKSISEKGFLIYEKFLLIKEVLNANLFKLKDNCERTLAKGLSYVKERDAKFMVEDSLNCLKEYYKIFYEAVISLNREDFYSALQDRRLYCALSFLVVLLYCAMMSCCTKGDKVKVKGTKNKRSSLNGRRTSTGSVQRRSARLQNVAAHGIAYVENKRGSVLAGGEVSPRMIVDPRVDDSHPSPVLDDIEDFAYAEMDDEVDLYYSESCSELSPSDQEQLPQKRDSIISPPRTRSGRVRRRLSTY